MRFCYKNVVNCFIKLKNLINLYLKKDILILQEKYLFDSMVWEYVYC